MLKQFLSKYFDLPNNFYTQENKYLLIGSMLGCGYFKKCPGTLTSFLTVIVAFLIAKIDNNLLIMLTILFTIVGLFVAEKISTVDNPDPQDFVLDEVVGQMIAMLLVSDSILFSLLAFVIFRALDINKPWIIGQAESNFKGGLAVMMDDILAGFITSVILLILGLIGGLITN